MSEPMSDVEKARKAISSGLNHLPGMPYLPPPHQLSSVASVEVAAAVESLVRAILAEKDEPDLSAASGGHGSAGRFSKDGEVVCEWKGGDCHKPAVERRPDGADIAPPPSPQPVGEASTPAFKVGDRVRVVKPLVGVYAAFGLKATIIAVISDAARRNPFTLKFDRAFPNDDGHCCDEWTAASDQIVHDPEPPAFVARGTDRQAATIAALREQLAEAKKETARAILTYGTHTSACPHHRGHDCLCGLEEARHAARDAYLKD